MAINFTKQVRDKFCPENNEKTADAGQLASPQRASSIAIRSVSERQPVPLLLGNAVAGQHDTTAPGSLGNRTVAQAGMKPSGSSMPNSPLTIKLLRKIDRLTGEDEGTSRRSLLRLHGNDAVHGNDMLAPLKINWLVTVDEPIAPGELSRAIPPPGGMPPVSAPPSTPGVAAPLPRKKGPMTPAEAFFQYPGPGAATLDYGQWMQSHPLHSMFDDVYPFHRATRALGHYIETPMHTVLKGGIHEPLSFHHSLMELSERTDGSSKEFETLYRNAMAVSHASGGLLREQADFFSRFFSALIALKMQPAQDDKDRIIETLRQEWLKTDFSKLYALPEANPQQAHSQAAKPARMQVSGRRPFDDAMELEMPPRKKLKADHQEASTTASAEPLASARQAPASPRHALPRTFDADSDTELSLSPERERSPVKTRLSWRSSILKRKANMTERQFKAWLANIPAKEVGATSGPERESSAQQASDQPVAGTAITPAQSHGKPLSN